MTDEAPKPRSIWQRMRAYRPSTRVSHAINVFIMVVNGSVAILTDNKWVAIVNALTVGFCICSSTLLTMFLRYRRLFRDQDEALAHMAAMHQALIQGKFRMMVAEIEMPDHDDGPSIAPSKLN